MLQICSMHKMDNCPCYTSHFTLLCMLQLILCMLRCIKIKLVHATDFTQIILGLCHMTGPKAMLTGPRTNDMDLGPWLRSKDRSQDQRSRSRSQGPCLGLTPRSRSLALCPRLWPRSRAYTTDMLLILGHTQGQRPWSWAKGPMAQGPHRI